MIFKRKNEKKDTELTIEEILSYNVVFQDTIKEWVEFEESLIPKDNYEHSWLGLIKNADLKTIAYEMDKSDDINLADQIFASKVTNNVPSRLMDLEIRLYLRLPKKYLVNIKQQLMDRLYSYSTIYQPYPTREEWDKTNKKYPYFYLTFPIKEYLNYNKLFDKF